MEAVVVLRGATTTFTYRGRGGQSSEVRAEAVVLVTFVYNVISFLLVHS